MKSSSGWSGCRQSRRRTAGTPVVDLKSISLSRLYTSRHHSTLQAPSALIGMRRWHNRTSHVHHQNPCVLCFYVCTTRLLRRPFCIRHSGLATRELGLYSLDSKSSLPAIIWRSSSLLPSAYLLVASGEGLWESTYRTAFKLLSRFCASSPYFPLPLIHHHSISQRRIPRRWPPQSAKRSSPRSNLRHDLSCRPCTHLLVYLGLNARLPTGRRTDWCSRTANRTGLLILDLP